MTTITVSVTRLRKACEIILASIEEERFYCVKSYLEEVQEARIKYNQRPKLWGIFPRFKLDEFTFTDGDVNKIIQIALDDGFCSDICKVLNVSKDYESNWDLAYRAYKLGRSFLKTNTLATRILNATWDNCSPEMSLSLEDYTTLSQYLKKTFEELDEN